MWIVVVIIHPRHYAVEWQTPIFAILSRADEHDPDGKWLPFFETLSQNTVAQVEPHVSSNGDSGSSSFSHKDLLLNSLSHNDLLLHSLSCNDVTQQLVTQRFVTACFVA